MLAALIPAAAYADPADSGPSLPTTSTSSWLVLGATTQLQRYDATRGVRAEADLVNLDGWTLGTAAAFARGTVGIYGGSASAELATTDIKAIAYVARAARFERWELRGQLGLGAIRTSASGDMMNLGATTPVSNSGVFPTAEAEVRATVPISPRWAVTGGPLLTYYDQWFAFDSVKSAGGSGTHRLGELVMVLGLSYRL